MPIMPAGKSPRRLISFEEDIFRDAAERLGGVYTEKQLRDVWNSYLSFLRGVLEHTDVMRMIVPYLGVVAVNRHLLLKRDSTLEMVKKKYGRLRPHQLDTRVWIRRKVQFIEDWAAKLGSRNKYVGEMYKDIRVYRQNLFAPLGANGVQDFQEREFYNL